MSIRIAVPVCLGLCLALACEPRGDGAGAAAIPGSTDANDVTGVTGGLEGNRPVAGSPNSPNAVAAALGPNVAFVGRVATWNGNQTVLSWSGSQIVGGFTGTGIAANLTYANNASYPGLGNVSHYVDVDVDGAHVATLEVSKKTQQVQLASGLAAGTHQVVVTKRTEAQIGSLLFSGFVYAAGGGPAGTAPAPARKIEFVGDSGLVGYGADGNSPKDAGTSCSFTTATENATASYAMVAAAALGAQPHIIGCSGKGLAKNRDAVNDGTNVLPRMWTWTIGDAELSEADWQPNAWPADAVVVNIGGNDFASGNGYSIAAASGLVGKGSAFLKQLRTAYPNAWLFVIVSPMLDENLRATAEAAANSMVAAVGAKAAVLPLPYDDGSRGYGCDYHMTVATHRFIGQALAASMKAKLGW